MAERNPFIPSERRQEMEERTRFNEEEANRRYAEQQAALRGDAEAQELPVQPAAPQSETEETTDDEARPTT